jgi:diketogulonate reductase-like aldo/keto reductase
LIAAGDKGGVDMNDIFITTKVHPRDLGYENTKAAIELSIERFGENKPLDLVLLHYPRCFIGVCTSEEVEATEKAGGWRASWKAMNELVAVSFC